MNEEDSAVEDSDVRSIIHIPKNMRDIMPKEHQYFTYFKKVVRHRCRQAGYRRFTTPVFENIELLKRAHGLFDENLDQFCFRIGQQEDVCLVQDRIPSAVRAYFENNMKDWPQPVELYYLDHIFKCGSLKEKQYTQAQQFGVEVLGESDPAIDAQVIQLAFQILTDLGIAKFFKLTINNVGTIEDQQKFASALQDFFIGKERYLKEEGVKFLYNDPLKLLSSDDEDIKILVELAPKYDQFLSSHSVAYFEQFKEFLTEVEVDFRISEKLFPPFPYFINSVFQFDSLSKIDGTMCLGGRYDGLSKKLGYDEDIAGFGFYMDVDGMLQIMRKEKVMVPSKDDLHVFVAQLGENAKKKCLRLINELRDAGVKCVGALGKGSMKEQLRLAQQFRVPYTVLMGVTEVKEQVVIIRNMKKGTQNKIPYDEAVENIVKIIGTKNLDKYSPGELIYG